MEDETQPRKQPQNFRSQASSNWRLPDSTPRSEAEKPRFQKRGSGQNAAPEASPGTRLYVGNLLYSAQREDVEQLFVDNGFSVVNVTISVDPFTGRNPSYCFVDLESSEEASRAMNQLNGSDLQGRPVKVNLGVAKKAGDGSSPQPRIKNYERGWGKEERGPSNDNYKPSFDRWSRNDASNHFQAPSEQGRRLYVGGLPRIEPQSAVDAEMQKLFEGFEIQAVSKIISPHPSKAEEPGNHYYLFVDLPNVEDVQTAVDKLDGKESPWGGQLRVNRAKDNRDRKVIREQSKANAAPQWR